MNGEFARSRIFLNTADADRWLQKKTFISPAFSVLFIADSITAFWQRKRCNSQATNRIQGNINDEIYYDTRDKIWKQKSKGKTGQKPQNYY